MKVCTSCHSSVKSQKFIKSILILFSTVNHTITNSITYSIYIHKYIIRIMASSIGRQENSRWYLRLFWMAFSTTSICSECAAFTSPSLRHRGIQTHQTRPRLEAAAAAAWGGDFEAEVEAAADLMCTAVRLCQQVQEELAIARGDTSLGTTVSASAAASSGAADVKLDGTPVTAADFAIQAYVSARLEELFPNDRFMGEEDATDLRADAALLQTSMRMASELLESQDLDKEVFLNAVDRGVEKPRGVGERVWILDPIDGTKGLITGKQYIVGLALTVNGKAVVSVMGNPAVIPEVMVAAKGQGLRYWPAAKGQAGCIDLPRNIPNNWHLQRFDFTKLVPDGSASFGWGSGSTGPGVAGVDYPPFLLSRPMSLGSPLPFGPMCAPSEVCCGAQVCYNKDGVVFQCCVVHVGLSMLNIFVHTSRSNILLSHVAMWLASFSFKPSSNLGIMHQESCVCKSLEVLPWMRMETRFCSPTASFP